jgi:DNA-binding CsgD family transcriptional regulator
MRLAEYWRSIKQAFSLRSVVVDRSYATTATTLVHAIGSAAILINRDHLILAANAAAETFLFSGAILRSNRKQLIHAGQSRLLEMVDSLFKRDSLDGFTLIESGERNTQVSFSVSSISLDWPSCGKFGHALIVIHSVNRSNEPDWNAVRFRYELTPAEIKVASLLASGMAVSRIADELSITRETVRTHLRRIFLKTGCHRQGDLIRVLLGSFQTPQHAP